MRLGNLSVDLGLSRSWVAHSLSKAEHLPISFVYGGQQIQGIPSDWNPIHRFRRIDANLIERSFEGRDPTTGLVVTVECWEYQQFPVVEWVAWFSNQSSDPTPILSNILAIDTSFGGAQPVLHHSNGDFYSEEGYQPLETTLYAGTELRMAPNAGRPCDGAFPYFRLDFDDRILTLAVGWPGQWMAKLKASEDRVHLQSGQEVTHLRLLPGEEIRTPRMTLMSSVGDVPRAINLWRRWYLEHVLPKPKGKPLAPLMACAGTDPGEEFTAATEENQIRYMNLVRKWGFDYDTWLMDAGWYPCKNEAGERKWVITGTWKPDPERFPSGLKNLAKDAAKTDATLWIWFEPERVYPGTEIDTKYPQWLLKIDSDSGRPGTSLLNLGNPECRKWITDLYCRLIADNGITIYRQDYNIDPLRYWRENDQDDREGMTENLYVQGYLQFWDDLLVRNPDIWIDSCASGGRRNDLETMRRSVPLHYSDFGYGNHPVKVGFQHLMFSWLPYFKESTLSWDLDQSQLGEGAQPGLDKFGIYCGMAPMILPVIDVHQKGSDFTTPLEILRIWREAAPFILHGDYYLLTPFTKSASEWVVRQFHCPKTGRGIVHGIRHRECPQDEMTVFPQELQTEKRYVFENRETGETIEAQDTDLAKAGLTLKLPARSSGIWFYKELA